MNASSVGPNDRTGSPLAWAAFTSARGGAFAAGSGVRDTNVAAAAVRGTIRDRGNPRIDDLGGLTGRRIPSKSYYFRIRNPIDTLFQVIRQLSDV
jgi:hypothetical protein